MKNERPIILKPYDPRWMASYESERQSIQSLCGSWMISIEHIGSTAVPGLAAKPTVDMMLGCKDEEAVQHCIQALETIGYIYWPNFFYPLPGRFDLIFRDIEGNRAYNLHFAEMGGTFWRRHLLFRDYLRNHPEVAREYQALKEALAEKYSPDIDAYANAKSEFIQAIQRRAGWIDA